MARFHGKVGYAIDVESEDQPGVWTKEVTERDYYGSMIREARGFSNDGQVNDSVSINNRVTIVSDLFANENLPSMVYVVIDGVYWRVSSVEINRPRLILNLGGVYNGPKAVAP